MSLHNGYGPSPTVPQLVAPDLAEVELDVPLDEATSYLLFESRGTLCGIATSAVREVLLLPEIAPLDGSPWWVGVLDVRGRIVPIVDPGELAGAGAGVRRFQTSDSVIIIESERGNLGIIVENVRDVRPLWADSIEVAPSGLVAGLARVDGEIVRLLDLAFFVRFAASENQPSEVAPARPFCPDASIEERALFAARARALRADANPAIPDASALSLVAVRLGGELFGFDLKWVREFATRPTVTPVPGAPADLLGLINLRGEVIPLLDLRPALGLAVADPPGEQITFIECEGVRLGVAVEAVLDVFAPAAGELLSPPAAAGIKGDVVSAAVFYGETTLAVLDLCNLLHQGGWTAREGVRML